MTPYQPADWHDLFVACAGAAAALTGLIFVAVSLNLAQILQDRRLPIRAIETLTLLIGLLLLSVFVLVPGQGRVALGAEITGLGAVLAIPLLVNRLQLPRAAADPRTWTVVPLIVIIFGTVPMIVAGVSVLAAAGGGLYWLIPQLVLAFTGAILNAWILLVEIQR
jgi:hypothetical protein